MLSSLPSGGLGWVFDLRLFAFRLAAFHGVKNGLLQRVGNQPVARQFSGSCLTEALRCYASLTIGKNNVKQMLLFYT